MTKPTVSTDPNQISIDGQELTFRDEHGNLLDLGTLSTTPPKVCAGMSFTTPIWPGITQHLAPWVYENYSLDIAAAQRRLREAIGR